VGESRRRRERGRGEAATYIRLSSVPYEYMVLTITMDLPIYLPMKDGGGLVGSQRRFVLTRAIRASISTLCSHARTRINQETTHD